MANRFLLTVAMTAAAGSFVLSKPAAAQLLPPNKKAAHVKLLQGPEPERADNYLTIIRWTSSNPGGTDRHVGVVRYGTDPKNLNQVAKSPIQLNRYHTETVFRVRMPPLKLGTTYYYTVDEEESSGESDKLQSPVKSFTVTAFTPPPAWQGH
jgi:Purple acid Phosphatase, N-terminal domain